MQHRDSNSFNFRQIVFNNTAPPLLFWTCKGILVFYLLSYCTKMIPKRYSMIKGVNLVNNPVPRLMLMPNIFCSTKIQPNHRYNNCTNTCWLLKLEQIQYYIASFVSYTLKRESKFWNLVQTNIGLLQQTKV